MSSLLPQPIGASGRDNEDKRRYVAAHLAEVEYRTVAFAINSEAIACESELRKQASLNPRLYRFPT